MPETNPLIVRPKGRTVAKVVIEVDEHGRTDFKAENITLAGPLPMHGLSLSALLVQILASLLIQLNAELIQQTGGPHAEKASGPSPIH